MKIKITSKTGFLQPLFQPPGENETEKKKEIRKNNKCVL